MRRVLFFLFIAVHFTNSYSQQPKDILNNQLGESIFMQFSNNFEANYGIIWMADPWIYYQNIRIRDNRLFFKDYEMKPQDYYSKNKILLNELRQHIMNCKFIEDVPKNTSMIVNVFYHNSKLLSFNYTDNSSKQTLSYSIPNNNFTKQYKYEDYKITFSTYQRYNKIFIDQYSYSDSLIKCINFNTLSKKYQITDQVFDNELLISKSYSKKTNNRNNYKIDETEKYYYDENKNLTTIKKTNGKGLILDSLKFFYKKGLLSNRVYGSIKDNNYIVYYKYDNDSLLVSKQIATGDNNVVTIKYFYNKEGLIRLMTISDKYSSSTDKFEFQYNTNSNLVNVSEYFYNTDFNKFEIKYNYSLSYDTDGMILSIKQMDSNGNITKEIEYETELVNSLISF